MLMLGMAAPLRAQVSVRVGAISADHAAGFQLAPSVRWNRGTSFGSVDASWAQFGGGRWTAQFGAREAQSRALGSLLVIGRQSALDMAILPGNVASGRLEEAFGIGHMAGQALLGVGLSGGVLRDVLGTFKPLASVRGSAGFGPGSIRVQQFFGNTGYTDLEAALVDEGRASSASAILGVRRIQGRWELKSRIMLAWSPSEILGIEVDAGRNAPSPEGFPAGYYAAGGIRLTAARRVPPPAVERTAAGARVAFAVSGREVAIAGEWNDWTPVPMTKDPAGRWVADVTLGPGAHKFMLIVDGKNVVPRGVPKLPDGFGGEVGLLVL